MTSLSGNITFSQNDASNLTGGSTFDELIKVVTWNANGLLRKQIEIPTFLGETDMDILLISETHFTDESYMLIPGFNMYHVTHPTGNARGGAALIIKRSLKHSVEIPFQSLAFQAVSVMVSTSAGDIRVASIYCPPNVNIKKEDYVELLQSLGPRFVVGGDWNAKHRRWGSWATRTRVLNLEKAAVDEKCEFFSQGYPTHWPADLYKRPDVIDFFVAKNVASNSAEVYALRDISSDHLPVLLLLSAMAIVREGPPRLFNEKTDWKAFRDEINEVIIDNEIISVEHLENESQLLALQIQNSLKKYTPPSRSTAYCMRVPGEIRELISLRRKARNKWLRSRHACNKAELNKANKNLSSKLWEIKHERTKKFLKSLTATQQTDYSLWRAIRYLKSTITHSPPLRKSDRSWAKSDEEKAEVFSGHLSTIFQPNQNIPGLDLDSLDWPPLIEPIEINPITHQEVSDEIKYKIKSKKVPGPDLIAGEILKALPGKAIEKLTKIFNAVLQFQHVPSTWKKAEVIVIPKPGKDGTLAESYRPISLLSNIEILENCFCESTTDHNEHTVYISLLFIRQIFIQDSVSFQNYAKWFKNLRLSNTQFSFLLQCLERIVPFEAPLCLKIHINEFPNVPCRTALSDYILLAKTRLMDLKEATEYLGIFHLCDKNGQKADLIKIISHFVQTGEIVKPLIEASVFRRQYFNNVFLPYLVGNESEDMEGKKNFIEYLNKQGMIPSSLYQKWQRSQYKS